MPKPIGAFVKTPSVSRLGDAGESIRLFGIVREVVSVISFSPSLGHDIR